MSDYVKKEFGANYLPAVPRYYKATQKNAQEAHEAIRPTNVNNHVSAISEKLGAQFAKLYEIIWRRAVATQMADAITQSTVVLVDVGGPVGSLPPASAHSRLTDLRAVGSPSSAATPDLYTLKANGSVLVFDGFLKVSPLALNDNKLPDFVTGENLSYVSTLSEAHETMPPPRYNDASIIKLWKKKGLAGRRPTRQSFPRLNQGNTSKERGKVSAHQCRFCRQRLFGH